MGQLVRNSFSQKGKYSVAIKREAGIDTRGSYYMNGNTAKKIEVQAENTALKNEQYADPKKWHKQDTTWALSLFGTAIGAGGALFTD